MNLKSLLLTLVPSLGLNAFPMQIQASTTYIPIWKDKRIIADAVRIDHLAQLQLFLNNPQGLPYKKFSAIQKQHPRCQIGFAMNAGMYHADFSPVGVYIEQTKQINKLNLAKNRFGNFFMQPNGVLAWNKNTAMIVETKQYAKSDFKADFATQSGPMLVMNGQINPIFIPISDSFKIRNGVGIQNNQLYFVISREKMNFYDFADIFKTQFNIDNALYLDGSISSAWIPQIKRYDQIYELGPMFIYSESKNCHSFD